MSKRTSKTTKVPHDTFVFGVITCLVSEIAAIALEEDRQAVCVILRNNGGVKLTRRFLSKAAAREAYRVALKTWDMQRALLADEQPRLCDILRYLTP